MYHSAWVVRLTVYGAVLYYEAATLIAAWVGTPWLGGRPSWQPVRDRDTPVKRLDYTRMYLFAWIGRVTVWAMESMVQAVLCSAV